MVVVSGAITAIKSLSYNNFVPSLAVENLCRVHGGRMLGLLAVKEGVQPESKNAWRSLVSKLNNP